MKKILIALALVLAFVVPAFAVDTPTVTPTITPTITPTFTPTFTPSYTPTVAMAIIKYGELNVDLEVNSFPGIKEKIIVVNGTTVTVKSGSSAFLTKILNVPITVGSNVIKYVARIFKSGTSGDTFTTVTSDTTVYSVNGWNNDTTKAQLEAYGMLTGATTTFTSKFPSADSRYAWAVSFAEDRLVLDIEVSSTAAAVLQVDTASNSTTAADKAIIDIGAATALGTAHLNGSAGFVYVPAGTFVGLTLTAGASTDEVRTVHYHTVKLSDLAKIKKP